jgi:hypothetical protein
MPGIEFVLRSLRLRVDDVFGHDVMKVIAANVTIREYLRIGF